MTVDAVMYYRILDPTLSVISVENVTNSTGQLAATTLRNILGTKTLQEILQDREHIAHLMQVYFWARQWKFFNFLNQF